MTRGRLIALLILTLAGTLVGLNAQRGNDRNRDEWQKIPEIFAPSRSIKWLDNIGQRRPS